MTNTTYTLAPNQFITAASGIKYAYREMGQKTGIPVILLTHLSANLDNWEPSLIDELAKKHWLIMFDNSGVGLSTGRVPQTIQAMARDALTFIHTFDFKQVDILSLSMGGMIAQELVLREPQLVRKLILTGTGPRGGYGIDQVTRVTNLDLVRAVITLKDVKTYLFFTRTAVGKRAAADFLRQIKRRQSNRDRSISLSAYTAQLKAIKRWGKEGPADLSKISQPTLIANGDHDRMVPTKNSYDLATRIPNSKLIIFKDAGHGSIFQYYLQFSQAVNQFLQN